MKLEALDIAAFGKFKNFHLDLTDDMTVVFGENEMGKTTLMAFIRMMFYGNTGKSSDIAKNPRKKYRPWNSDIMAGSITFTFEGCRYRLEREFKGSNSADKISLVDLDTGSVQSLSGSSDIGAKFFGLTDAAFERSVFLETGGAFSQNDAAHGELNARLSNIAITGDEDTSFEAVAQRLTKAKEALFSKRGKIGKSDKASAELQHTQDLISAAQTKEAEIIELLHKADRLENSLNESSAESSRLFETFKNADKMKKRIFVERYLHALKDAEECNKRLLLTDGSLADISFVKKTKLLYDRTSTADKKLLEIKEQLGHLDREVTVLKANMTDLSDNSDTDIQRLLSQNEDTDKRLEDVRNEVLRLDAELEGLKPLKKVNIPLIIAGGLVFAIGTVLAILGIIGLLIPLLTSAVGVVILLLGFVAKRTIPADNRQLRTKLTENSRKISELLDLKQKINCELDERRSGAEKLKLEFAAKQALLDSKLTEFEQKRAALVEAEKEASLCLNELKGHISVYKEVSNLAEAIHVNEILEQDIILYDNIKDRLVSLASHSGCNSKEEAEARLKAMDEQGITTNLTEQELDLIKEKFKAQSEISGKIRSELAAIKTQVKVGADSTPSIAVLQRKKAELSSLISEFEAFAQTTDIALEVLEESFRELRKNYSGALEQKTAEIFLKLTGNKYSAVNISKDFELSVSGEDAFGLKESTYLSCGTENQLYLALRLALSELITCDTEALPMLMDDPLADYDDTRARRALEFLKDYSKNKQLIMFTCHKGFADTAEMLGVKTLNL